MRFTCRMVFARIAKNWKRYSLIFLQIAVGVGVLYTALCMNFVAIKEKVVLQNAMDTATVTIHGYSSQNSAITPEDLVKVEAACPSDKHKIAFEEITNLVFLINGQETTIPVFAVSENYYAIQMGFKPSEPSPSYIGKNIWKALQDNQFTQLYGDEWNAQAQTLYGIPLQSFLRLEDNVFSKTAYGKVLNGGYQHAGNSATEQDFNYSIFIPASGAPSNGTGVLYVTVDKTSATGTETYCKRVLAALQEAHPEATFYYDNPSEQLQNSYTAMEKRAELLGTVAGVIIVTVVFGFIGILLLILNDRIRALAICRMCGASVARLVVELLCEVGFVTVGSTLFGIGCAAILLPLQNTIFVPVYHTWQAAAICCGLSAIVCVLVSGLSILRIIKISPMQALRGL